MNCTKPNCDCAEKEMEAQGTECIKSYPCLGNSPMKEHYKHLERLNILEMRLGDTYYNIGGIHNKLSEAMEEYASIKVAEYKDKVEGKVMKEFDKEIDTILGKHKLPTTGDIIVSDVLKISKTIVLKAIKEI
jgi:succinate dehydrogenase/fumarate reductase flavoprotein subunit